MEKRFFSLKRKIFVEASLEKIFLLGNVKILVFLWFFFVFLWKMQKKMNYSGKTRKYLMTTVLCYSSVSFCSSFP